MHTRRVVFILFGLIIIAGIALFGFMRISEPEKKIPQEFNSQRAIGDVEYQLSIGSPDGWQPGAPKSS